MTTTPTADLMIDNDELTVRVVAVSEMENNVYLITSKSSGEQVLIDAADNFDRIREFVESAADEDLDGASARLSTVITTHSHWDHIRALPATVQHFEPHTVAGHDDVEAIDEQEGVSIAQAVVGGETLRFEGFELEVISLVGHTPGSITLVLRGDSEEATPTILFTGDSLFPGGVGKTNSPEDFKQLLHDVRTKIFDAFDDNTIVLPGHGQHTTLGADRDNLDEWEARGW
ncbi:MBL fold metallo-hydrolase [Rothia terrae]|uniref:MBL fold metallo-hydrolase n=1 Tax=Rothia terrae TaxID=396015 RepID=UPI00380B9A44